MLDNEYLQGIAGKTRSDRELTVMEQMAQELLAARKVVRALAEYRMFAWVWPAVLNAIDEYDQLTSGGKDGMD